MIANSIIESPSSARVTDGSTTAGRPDVGVIVNAGDSLQALDLARAKAAATGGKVCVIGYLDTTGIRSPHALINTLAAARAHVTQVVSRHIAQHPDALITERFHVWTLPSLLTTMERSIGVVVIERARDGTTKEIVSLCPVPVVIAQDSTGETEEGESEVVTRSHGPRPFPQAFTAELAET